MKTRNTKQRRVILQFLHENPIHPTAQTVYEGVREKLPNISLGTVYRNLNLLAETGRIRKVQDGGNQCRFDGTSRPHVHLICEQCGEIIDIHEVPYIETEQILRKYREFEIKRFNLDYFGRCERCADKEKR